MKLFICCAVLCSASEVGAEPENFVKAAFLYKFVKFVEWPAQAFKTPETPVVVCILGDDPFGPALEILKNKPVGKRKLFVIKHKEINKHKESIHIVFVSASEKKRLDSILSRFKGRPILTIGDTEGFAAKGGIINMVKRGGKIGFEINIKAAKHSGLKISSRLLKLAIIVDQ
ncbi:MAG: YfiR family protein [Desulfobacteraceae bacterium]|nr:YfiR family protein [Desulfobacteraceae bacterium]